MAGTDGVKACPRMRVTCTRIASRFAESGKRIVPELTAMCHLGIYVALRTAEWGLYRDVTPAILVIAYRTSA